MERNLDNYFIHRIPKKSNGKIVGTRILEEPIPELKQKQKVLISKILEHFIFPPHINAITGTNTLTNSSPHINKIILYKIDLKDYFHTVTIQKLERVISAPFLIKEIREHCMYNGRLPTGAPTSPLLSIIAFLPVDWEILDIIKNKDIAFTRYMDDLSFSANSFNIFNPNIVKAIKSKIVKAGFLINNRKSGLSLSFNRQQVTGVITNHHANIAKETRLLLRAKIDHVARKHEPLSDKIKGELSYIRAINIDLYNKYLSYYNKRINYYGLLDSNQ